MNNYFNTSEIALAEIIKKKVAFMCFLNYLFSQLNKHGVSLLHSILLQLTSAWHQTKSSCRLLWRQLPWRQDTLGTVVMDTG